MARGGKRVGAGRPKGKGKYGEETKPMRIPLSMVDEVCDLVENKGYACPLFSSRVAAGGPVAADDTSERVDLNKHLIQNPSETFFVTVSGESMLGAGIHPDDMLVVDRSIQPRNNNIIVASVNGEVTVKTYDQRDGRLQLLPENDAYEPIPITAETDFHIWGVVTNVIHAV